MTQANQWHIGFAQTQITPGKAIHMAGFGRERYAEGTIAPLIAQALILKDKAGKLAVIISADVVGFGPGSLWLIRDRLLDKHGISESNVILIPSHTHWGPAVIYRNNFTAGAPSFWYLKELEEKLLKLVDEAATDMSEAYIDYWSADVQLGHCRRKLVPEKNLVEWAPNPQGHYDRHTPVFKVYRPGHADVKEIYFVSHACHPTSTGTIDKWSPDYPGAMRDWLTQKAGSGTRAMFAMGAGADAKVTFTNPDTGVPVFAASPPEAKKAGESLAQQVWDTIQSQMPVHVPASLTTTVKTTQLPLTRWKSQGQLRDLLSKPDTHVAVSSFARQSLEFPDTRTDYEYQITGWNMGGVLTLIAMPDEVCSPWGPKARSLAKTPNAMLIGYANHVHSYIPDERIRAEGGYEGESSHRAFFLPGPFAKGVEEKIEGCIKQVVQAIDQPLDQ